MPLRAIVAMKHQPDSRRNKDHYSQRCASVMDEVPDEGCLFVYVSLFVSGDRVSLLPGMPRVSRETRNEERKSTSWAFALRQGSRDFNVRCDCREGRSTPMAAKCASLLYSFNLSLLGIYVLERKRKSKIKKCRGNQAQLGL